MTRQPQRRIRRHPALTVNDLVDAPGRNGQRLRQSVLADPERPQELFLQDLPGETADSLRPRPLADGLVVVDDLDILCVTFLPAKAHPPLIVDANTVLSCSIPGQLLEAIPGWHPEILDRFRGVEEHQLAQCNSPDIRRQLPDRFASEQPLRLAVPEAPDHSSTSLTRADHNGKRYGLVLWSGVRTWPPCL